MLIDFKPHAILPLMLEKSNLSNGLYLISTPIGNMRDITLRTLDVVRELDLLLCEDTRISKKILHAYDLQPKKVLSYHAHNQQSLRADILKRLERNEKVGLMSDAGTPLVSDPGLELVQASIEKGIAVIPIPGCSALLAALTASGLSTEPFTFCGFPPHTLKKKRLFFENLAPLSHTTIFFESPHRLYSTLTQMSEIFSGYTRVTLAKEITKLHEQFFHTTLQEITHSSSKLIPPQARGEYVILLAPESLAKPTKATMSEAQLLRLLQQSLPKEASPIATKAVVQTLHVATQMPKKLIYNLALTLQKR